jgi:high affinity Mn2+ porin
MSLRATSIVVAVLTVVPPMAFGQATPVAAEEASPDSAGWTVHGQTTVIEQWHYSFPSPYQGANSLEAQSTEDKHTVSATLFIGRRLWTGGSIYYDPEFTEGNGLSDGVGVAGFPNGEGTRAGSTTPIYDTARLYLQQVVGFGGPTEKVEDDQNELSGVEDIDRLTLTLGKFAATDVFDDNAYSHDPRTQFLNWALMDSGAWDYPANAKGYTVGFAAVLNRERWALRYGILMEPLIANELELDEHFDKAYGQVLQWDQRYEWSGQSGTLRPFVFWNRAHMGSYSEALDSPVSPPDVTDSREYRSKVGAGLSWDQSLNQDLGAFARLSWDDGHTESWAFTEIDRSAATGLSLNGESWSRKEDVVGLAAVVNGLSALHREYLAAGGTGFIIGDGRLNYGPEEILEVYYAAKICSWLTLSPDYQYVEHPAYNRDRGGVSIYAIRAHAEF